MKNKKTKYIAIGAMVLGIVLYGGYVFAQGVERKIVIFEDGLSEQKKDEIVRNIDGEQVKNLPLVNGRVVMLGRVAQAKLEGVARIDEDVVVTTMAKNSPADTQAAQVLPWGVDRIDAELVWSDGNNADPIKVGILDTGISNKHKDLIANIKGGINTINTAKSWNDDNGHGSHVAGIVGAIHDAYGVVGVAPKVDLYAIKALGANGSGYVSDIIEGIDYSIRNGINVVNMSLGTTANVQALQEAVIAAKNAGVIIVAAAGNNGSTVNYPAAYPEVIAVSATNQGDTLASFSSRGPEVDFAAPGVSIYSTYKGTGYATLSGTSMASPHVAGAIALILNTSVGIYDVNVNGKWDFEEVVAKLKSGAVDLGAAGFDSLYGWGLVNAYQSTR